jgi:flavin reductase (DIM6/NTAB) family NADH-FMN oxidoreductase RutF
MTVAIQPDLFRALLRRHAAGVVVITAPGGRPAGFTATSFTSVSLAPPLVSFCLDRGSSSWPAVSVAGHVAVHVLTAEQQHLARTFATHGIDRFAPPTRWRTGPHDVPVLDGVLAVLICRADHGATLLYHMGRYLDARRSRSGG